MHNRFQLLFIFRQTILQDDIAKIQNHPVWCHNYGVSVCTVCSVLFCKQLRLCICLNHATSFVLFAYVHFHLIFCVHCYDRLLVFCSMTLTFSSYFLQDICMRTNLSLFSFHKLSQYMYVYFVLAIFPNFTFVRNN